MLLNKYYDWNLIKELPVFFLKELLEEAANRELEKNALPLWAINKIANEINRVETIDFNDYLNQLKGMIIPSIKKERTPEEIENDFLKIVQQDKKGGDK